MTTNQYLELEDFFLQVESRVLLAGVDLSFQPSGITAIFGRSGTGKTTFLKALSYLASFTGSIRLGGLSLEDLKPQEVRTRIQYLHQEPWLFEGTVRENLAVAASFKQNHKLKPDETVIMEHLAGLDLEPDILDQEARKLSGGEKQRVALIRSLLLEPEFLLLDEPTSAMDVSSEEIFLAYLRNLAWQPGIIIVSHSIQLISTADRVLLLADQTLAETTGELDQATIRRLVEDG